MKTISGNIIDVTGRNIFSGTINIDGEKISDIKRAASFPISLLFTKQIYANLFTLMSH